MLDFKSPSEEGQKSKLLELLNCFLTRGPSISLFEDEELQDSTEVTLRPEQIMSESRTKYTQANAHSIIEKMEFSMHAYLTLHLEFLTRFQNIQREEEEIEIIEEHAHDESSIASAS